MKYPDEMLMAYADGELEAPQRAAIEQAMRDDPAVAAAVERHQALRRDVFDAFASVLDEPVPARLQPPPKPAPAQVVPLEQVRAAREERAAARRRWSWPEWGALAASVAVGVLAGGAGLHVLHGESMATVAEADGKLVAEGRLADALTEQLTSTRQGDVRIGASFMSKEGVYCRSFTLGASAGLACRAGDDWRIPVLAEQGEMAATEYRKAAAPMPEAVLDAIDARIAGTTLDANGERVARERGWQR